MISFMWKSKTDDLVEIKSRLLKEIVEGGKERWRKEDQLVKYDR